MLSVNYCGGLGNQLFQIFNLLSLSLKYNKNIILVNKKIKRKTYWDSIFKDLKKYMESINEKFYTYKEKHFHYKEIILNSNNNIILQGYFQSYKYFKEYENDIFKIINLYEQQNCVCKKYKIYNFNNLISLHFRLGDYKKKQKYHPIISMDYYINALKMIYNKTDEKNDVLCFYEKMDKDIVKQNIDILKENFKNINFIFIDTEILDYEQMLLMSLTNHNIIANSTFSWWGAYLNRNKDKIVTYPSIWFGPANENKITSDLFPNDWIKI